MESNLLDCLSSYSLQTTISIIKLHFLPQPCPCEQRQEMSLWRSFRMQLERCFENESGLPLGVYDRKPTCLMAYARICSGLLAFLTFLYFASEQQSGAYKNHVHRLHYNTLQVNKTQTNQHFVSVTKRDNFKALHGKPNLYTFSKRTRRLRSTFGRSRAKGIV